MNIRRIIVLNIILYIATFIVAALVLAIKGTSLQVDVPPTGDQIFIAMVTGIVLTTFGAWWFFRTEPATASKGFQFGVIAILVGFAMDAVVSVGILMSGKNPLDFLQGSFTHWFFGLMLGLGLCLTGLVAWGMGKRRAGSEKNNHRPQ